MPIREVENILQKKKSPGSAIFISETIRNGKLYSFPSWIVGEGVDWVAFSGRHSFLRDQEMEKKTISLCVSALEQATRISTNATFFRAGLNPEVSMPSNGPHSFLPASRSMRSFCQTCVNALKRAALISTWLYGLRERGTVCQCPQTGRTHFYKW